MANLDTVIWERLNDLNYNNNKNINNIKSIIFNLSLIYLVSSENISFSSLFVLIALIAAWLLSKESPYCYNMRLSIK